IVASRRARMQKAAAALPQRVSAEVSREATPAAAGGAPRASHAFAYPRRLASLAAYYLALAPPALEARLLAGKSLAQVADEAPGKSKAGLVAALVAAMQGRIDV